MSNNTKTFMLENSDSIVTKDNPDEYFWVDGYKAVNKNMTAYCGFKYEVGVPFSLGENLTPVECVRGFHFCQDLRDTVLYYEDVNMNRYFEVKALIRKKDYGIDFYKEQAYITRLNGSSLRGVFDSLTIGAPATTKFLNRADKIVAKEIVLTRELSEEEIFRKLGGHLRYPFIKDVTLEDFKKYRFKTKEEIKLASKQSVANTLYSYTHSVSFAELLAEFVVTNNHPEIIDTARALWEEGCDANTRATLLMRLAQTRVNPFSR